LCPPCSLRPDIFVGGVFSLFIAAPLNRLSLKRCATPPQPLSPIFQSLFLFSSLSSLLFDSLFFPPLRRWAVFSSFSPGEDLAVRHWFPPSAPFQASVVFLNFIVFLFFSELADAVFLFLKGLCERADSLHASRQPPKSFSCQVGQVHFFARAISYRDGPSAGTPFSLVLSFLANFFFLWVAASFFESSKQVFLFSYHKGGASPHPSFFFLNDISLFFGPCNHRSPPFW